jgi:hypothetical protein
MVKRGVLWVGCLLIGAGCNNTGAKRPELVEAHPEEFFTPPAGYERPPTYLHDDRPLLTKQEGGSLNTNPAGGVGMPSPSPNMGAGARR